jgi:hypothetical protein
MKNIAVKHHYDPQGLFVGNTVKLRSKGEGDLYSVKRAEGAGMSFQLLHLLWWASALGFGVRT